MFNKEKPVRLDIDVEKCTTCGICADNCPGEFLILENNKIIQNKESKLGCVQCGNCMMLCPNNAIKITGENISPYDAFELNNNLPSSEQLLNLLKKRRSARSFEDKAVPIEVLDSIIEAAATGAISVPPSEVKVLIIQGFDKVRSFKTDLLKEINKMYKLFNTFLLTLLKPFIGKDNYKLYKEFVLPLFKTILEKEKEGKDKLLYNAPCVLIFYTTTAADKEDSIIASTLANTTAESLGLSCCIIGSVAPVINTTKPLKEKLGIGKNETVSTAMVLGYPKMKYTKGINRKFKQVRYL